MVEAWLDVDAVARIETPAVVVDLDRVEANIARMAAAMRDRDVALRPHAKTHKSLEFGRRQLSAGAIGLTVATLGEAEVFTAGGGGAAFLSSPLFAGGAQ